MKILQIIGDLGTGGAEKLLCETVPLLNENNVTTDVAVLNGRKTPFLEQLLSKQVKIRVLGSGSLYNPLLIFKIIPLLRQYDLIHVHLFPAQYWVVFAKWISFSSATLVFTEHSTNNRRLARPFFRMIEKVLYRAYSGIVCITDEVSESLARMVNIPRHKMKIIENGINIESINASEPLARGEFQFADRDVLLIMVARFRHEKDQDTVIRALKELPDHYKLLFVGDGERENACKQLVADLALTKRVLFLGERTDVYGLIKMSDIFVLSSHWEGFGLAAAEGMAAGIPAIASDVAGLAQVVGDGGVLFSKGDYAALAEKVLKLESDPEYYKLIAERGKHRAEQFDIRSMVQKLISYYAFILK